MKRLMSTFCVAAACFVAAAGVQSASASSGQAEKKMDTSVTVTGCVAAGAATGQYTLTDATLAPSAVDKMPPPAADKMSAPATSYTLKGGEDLKPHVGHKVAVTGTLAKPDMSKEKMPTEAPKADKMTTGGTLNVTSVKMVSATCP